MLPSIVPSKACKSKTNKAILGYDVNRVSCYRGRSCTG
uniref:Uncharacterized protein n=1 Tax=Arundo donax TaxID=35708 RepID=A0A0A9HEE9_ARUDO